METERFSGNWTFFYVVSGVFMVVVVLGVLEQGLNEHILLGGAVFVAGVVIMYITTTHTYLEIRDKRTLINSGYKTFGHDELDIYDVKYIYRIPQFMWRGLGTVMVLYIKGDDGTLKHSIVREVNYTDASLRGALTKLTQLNPNIELDSEYQAFLEGKDDQGDDERFADSTTNNTKESVEAMLRAKGESW